eukprot:3899735-Pleurochrysis_carterae.AAC.2
MSAQAASPCDAAYDEQECRATLHGMIDNACMYSCDRYLRGVVSLGSLARPRGEHAGAIGCDAERVLACSPHVET